MSKFEDSVIAPKPTLAAEKVDWTEEVRTRDYYPTRFEYIFKDVLCGMLSRTSPKDEHKTIQRALNFTRQVEDALDSTEG